jgi:hypothetical protein
MLSCYLAPNGGIHLTEPLHSNDRRVTHTWEEFVKYALHMDSVSMVYIPSFIKIGSGIQKLIRGLHRHTEWRLHEPTLGK